MLNQNVKLINDMRAARNVYAAFESMLTTDMDQDKWSKAYPGHWKIVAKVQRLRMEMKRGNNRS